MLIAISSYLTIKAQVNLLNSEDLEKLGHLHMLFHNNMHHMAYITRIARLRMITANLTFLNQFFELT